MIDLPIYIHPAAEISPDAHVGTGTWIWNQVQVRGHAHIIGTSNTGKGVYIGAYVHIGSCVKMQNPVPIFIGIILENGILVGPHVSLIPSRSLCNRASEKALKPVQT